MYDIIIIGAGTAGISAYKAAVQKTQNILIINQGPWDTTCARVGCMPSKILISSANRALDIHTANTVGLTITSDINTDHVMSHLRNLRDRFTNATLKDVNRWNSEHKISGTAQFVDQHTVEVNGQHYQAKSFIIAVGSTPIINPQWKTELQDRLITSDQIFELEQLPQSIAIVGSGVIALELAQALNHLGVKTTVFARSKRLGTLTSPILQEDAQQVISKNLNIFFETLIDTVQTTSHGVRISFNHKNQIQTLDVEYVLAATGRSSLLSTLHLENINPTFADLKILPVDLMTKQLADYPIFIVGDAYTLSPLQHEAAHEGKYTVANCLNYPNIQPVKTLTPLGIVFSNPQMATVGQSYKQLKQNHVDFIIGYSSYTKQGRALVSAQDQGSLEVYIDAKTQKLLGAEIFMATAEHLAHLLAWMIDMGATLEDLINKPFYHPTLEEGLRTALKHARRQLQT